MSDLKEITEYCKRHEWCDEALPVLPEDAVERKQIPVYRGFIKYFPRAIVAVTRMSVEGQQQHNPDGELSWIRSKSADDKDALMRHILDEDWEKVAWRAMAILEKKLESQ